MNKTKYSKLGRAGLPIKTCGFIVSPCLAFETPTARVARAWLAMPGAQNLRLHRAKPN